MTLEDQRLEASEKRTENWHRWGPYLSERQWGTVREDYSPGGENTWGYLSHDQARSRAFRWGEDGLLGICDRQCRLCFSVALWNGNDPILKERLFGVTGPEGNHGEDVKELYYYDDSTPTHSWMRATYKYPQCEYPYAELVEENSKRGLQDPEFEIEDTKAFDDNCYFDVVATYAKATPDDILIDVTITNCGPKKASIHVLPQFFFRNTWTWQCTDEGCTARPSARDLGGVIETNHETLGKFFVACESIAPDPADDSRWVFCDNETNSKLHPDMPSEGEYYKDAFHRLIVDSEEAAINPKKYGTKFAAYHQWELAAGESRSIRLRMAASKQSWTDNSKNAAEKMHALAFNESFGATIEARKQEADDFYASRIDAGLSEERKAIMRQSYAGLLWTKQFYHYVVDTWLKGDPNGMPIADGRNDGRNSSWRHLFNRDVVSMPDKWEYPWYAAWDLAFHMVPVAQIDIEFAKSQMLLFLREWYMHPSGQIPAYEWNLSDVNPPVHAWGVWQVYKATGPPEKRDKVFLARCFQKLLLNFTWWINRKDPNGRNIFAGGFLGLDNIGVFDRSRPLCNGFLEQADGTSWMAFYCGSMLRMALELAEDDPAYGDMASKFFEHYVAIAEAMNTIDGTGLWEDDDGFYYDHLYVDNRSIALRVRSLVGLLPLTTGVILEDRVVDKLPGFRKRTRWFLEHRGNLADHMTYMEHPGADGGAATRLLAIPSEDRFKRILAVMLDENEFLSPFGIRSLSAAHREKPFIFEFNHQRHEVHYVPGESDSYMFGGNSNWRGPIWFPMNFLLIQSLKRYHDFYGDEFKVECPTGSGNEMTLLEVARELERRCISLFEASGDGERPCHGGDRRYSDDPAFASHRLFHEYFHADTGKGLGASHQTGWTALVASMIRSQSNMAKYRDPA